MDSKQLYIAAKHLRSSIRWDHGWIHFGTNNEIDHDVINRLMDDFLTEEHPNLVHRRKNSGRYHKSQIKAVIPELLGTENFHLWNEALPKVIEFNRIGVLRIGRR